MNKEVDFLTWHDCKVYSINFPNVEGNLAIDIDYIVEWIRNPDSLGYKFVVAPAILVFLNISNLNLKIEMNDMAEIFIDEIKRMNYRVSPNGKATLWDFRIILNSGEITFTSTGYQQTITDEPLLGEEQKYKRKFAHLRHFEP